MAPSTLENFHVTRDTRGVATVLMDVPGRTYNVFTEEVFAELGRLVADLQRDVTIRLVLFQSGKESGFHVGADLRTIAAIQSPEAADEFIRIGQKVLDQIERLPMPTVAVIHGPCLGGGLEFALACRYRLVQDDASARLGLPEVKLGLLPGWGGTNRLPALVGPSAALRMLLAARKLSASQAAEIGLVDGLWPPERFADGVEQFVVRPIGRASVAAAERRTARTLSPTDEARALDHLAGSPPAAGSQRPPLSGPTGHLGRRRARHPSWPRRRLDARTADVS